MSEQPETVTEKERVEQELIAMRQIGKVLMGLNLDARRRVFSWLSDFYLAGPATRRPDLFFGPTKVYEERDEHDPG